MAIINTNRLIVMLGIFVFIFSKSVAQSENSRQQLEEEKAKKAEAKIMSLFYNLKPENIPTPILNIPQRKYDSPLFCDEFIKYKNGYIINFINTDKSGRDIEQSYYFYYLDLNKNKLFELNIPGFDTVESLISDNSVLYISGKQRGMPLIVKYEDGKTINIQAIIPNGTEQSMNNNWIKLGFYNGNLYALEKNGLHLLKDQQWETITKFCLDSFYTKKLHYRFSRACIPTENIKITNGKVYFLQEIVQERISMLLEFSINENDSLIELWDKLGLTDNYQKEINSFTLADDGSIFIGASRLWEKYLLIRLKNNATDFLIFNNHTKSGLEDKEIEARKVLIKGSDIYLACDNGIFKMTNDSIKPLAYFTDNSQEIKDKDGDIQFDFYPRCFEQLTEKTYLLGGLFGGICLVDLSNNKIKWLDDINNDKVPVIKLDDIH